VSPRVSVIVPLFNARATVRETLESVLSQSLTDWEAIVVNDGSTDDGPAMADAFVRRDPRFRMVHQPNRGLGAARNTGIEGARGEFLNFLDADDTLRHDALERLVVLATASDHGAAACGWSCVGPALEPLDWTLAPPRGSFGVDELLESNRAVVHAMLVSRATLGEHRFDASLPVVEDYDLWLRIASRGVRWTTSDEALVRYRLRPDSMSRNTRTMWETTRRVLDRAFAESRRGDHGVDASDERQRRVLSAMSLVHGAVLASRDPAGGAAIVAEAPRSSLCDPALIARTLHGAIPLGLGLPPHAWRDGRGEPLFATARDWTPGVFGDLTPTVLDRLAALTVDPAHVARRLTERLPPEERVALVGAGRNGAVAAEALAHRGIRFGVYDDDSAASQSLAGAFAAPVFRDLDQSAGTGVMILTPGDDSALAKRVPRGREVRRWSIVAGELGRRARSRLERTRPAKAA